MWKVNKITHISETHGYVHLDGPITEWGMVRQEKLAAEDAGATSLVQPLADTVVMGILHVTITEIFGQKSIDEKTYTTIPLVIQFSFLQFLFYTK